MTPTAIKIMMIDNDPAAHCYHKTMIEKAGLDQHLVSDYLEVGAALSDIQQAIRSGHPDHLPDVILVDINMPDIDGWAFVEQLKSMKIAHKCPEIYMVSNSLNPIDKIKVENSTFVHGFKQKFLGIDFFKGLSSGIKEK